MASKLLSDDEQSYFMEMESLFNHPGWTRLSKEILAEAQALPARMFAAAKSWEDVQQARARFEALETLLSYPSHIDQRRANIERERQLQIEEVNEL